MSYLFGGVAFVQITFLPGFLFLGFSKIKSKTFVEKIVFIFAVSLIANFVLVYLLTLLKLYLSITVYLVFSLEFVAFFLLAKKKKLSFSFPFSTKKNGFLFLLLLISTFVVARFLLPFLQNLSLKSVFLDGDAIDSWNVWATQWAQNKIPLATGHYSQLIPTNWSLTYVFMQTLQIELFAKLLMPLFILAILLIFFDLGNYSGLIMVGVLFHYYFDNSFLRDGYVDLAFSFFAFLPFYYLILYRKYKKKHYLFLMLFFALGSFLTKQLGLYILLLTLVSFPDWKWLRKNKLFLILSIFLSVITLSWYILKLPEIRTTYNIESIYHAAMTDKLTQFSLLARLQRSFFLLVPNIKGICIFCMVIFLALFSLKNKQSRQIFYFIIIPIFAFWTLFLNYDQRNLAVIFPYLGFACFPVALHQKVKKIGLNIHSLTPIVVFFILLFAVSILVPTKKLFLMQTQGKKQIGIPELNLRLYDYYYKKGFSGKISTSYYRLCNLPEIGKYCLYVPGKIPVGKYYLYPKEIVKNKKNLRIIFSYQDWLLLSSK